MVLKGRNIIKVHNWTKKTAFVLLIVCTVPVPLFLGREGLLQSVSTRNRDTKAFLGRQVGSFFGKVPVMSSLICKPVYLEQMSVHISVCRMVPLMHSGK